MSMFVVPFKGIALVQETRSICFPASRLKASAAPPLILVLIGCWLKVFGLLHVDSIARMRALLALRPILLLPLLILIVLEVYSIAQVIRPGRLLLASNGWTVEGVILSQFKAWADFDEPTKAYLSAGRGGKYVVKLKSRKPGRDAIVYAGAYQAGFDRILEAMRQSHVKSSAEQYS